jgi:DNA-binding beta-propeller fold protein YncE
MMKFSALAIAFLWLGGPTQGSAASFNRISTFFICSQIEENCNTDVETVAEIVAVSKDGNTAVYSDSAQGQIGFVDITDAANPKGLGSTDVGGEPTSVNIYDNTLVFAAVNTSPNYVNTSGLLVILDLITQDIIASHELPGQPDSIKISPDGKYIGIAIENERDEDLGDGTPPQMPPGYFVIVETTPKDPADWVMTTVDITGLAGCDYPEDPEPEFVDINDDNIAVMTMQENNCMVMIDMATGTVMSSFSAGAVDLDMIDTDEEDLISQYNSLTQVPREPDGVAWIGTTHFVTADEGDLNGGSRGLTEQLSTVPEMISITWP